MPATISKPRRQRPASADWPHANQFEALLDIAADAASIWPPFYLNSLFGPTASWMRPSRKYSEFTIFDPWRPLRTLKYLRDTTVPARPLSAPDWAERLMPKAVKDLLWRPSRFFQQNDAFGSPCSFPDERWFFINGIGTNADVASLNAAFLTLLFHRPITVIQNATDSLLVDLVQCAVGKGFKTDPNSADSKTMTEPAWKATIAILEALSAPATKRVVVIAHSQGTIIAANVLRAIAKTLQGQDLLSTRRKQPEGWHKFTDKLMGGAETGADKSVRDDLAHSFSVFGTGEPSDVTERLEKLEIYTFANCADKMTYVARQGRKKYPYLEHLANEFDVVARLGILSPNDKIDIDGPTYLQKGAWGHLLNEHHLFAIDDYLYPSAKHRRMQNPYEPGAARFAGEPRLYGYFHGNCPVRGRGGVGR